MATKSVTFRVVGSGSFPVDMLRYDACWPRDQDAVAAFHESGERGYTRSVWLSRHEVERPAGFGGVTIDRWASFGWRVAVIYRENRVIWADARYAEGHEVR